MSLEDKTNTNEQVKSSQVRPFSGIGWDGRNGDDGEWKEGRKKHFQFKTKSVPHYHDHVLINITTTTTKDDIIPLIQNEKRNHSQFSTDPVFRLDSIDFDLILCHRFLRVCNCNEPGTRNPVPVLTTTYLNHLLILIFI